MEDRQHTTKECADKLLPEIICFRKKFDQVSMHSNNDQKTADVFLVKTAFENCASHSRYFSDELDAQNFYPK